MPARFLRRFDSLLERLGSVGLLSSGVILAAQAFLALVPLLMAVAAWLPTDTATGIQDSMRERLGLSGNTDAAVSQLVGNRDDLRRSLTAFGAVVVFLSAISFSRALQRVYELAWQLPSLGLRGTLRGFMWLVGLVAYVAVLGLALRLVGGGQTGTVLRTVATAIGSIALWSLTPYVLLAARVRLRALLPCGVLTSAALVVLGVFGSVYVPRSVRNNERKFGTIGVVFAVQSWLIVVGCVIVGAAVVAAVAAQSGGPLGRLCRGTASVDDWRRTSTS